MKSNTRIHVILTLTFFIVFLGVFETNYKFASGLPRVAPFANAGPSQTAHPGDIVTLDGSRSYDPNGDKITSYAWNYYPYGTVANKTGPDVVLTYDNSKPAFAYFGVPPTITSPVEYTFKLVVSKEQLSSTPSYTTVYVVPKSIKLNITSSLSSPQQQQHQQLSSISQSPVHDLQNVQTNNQSISNAKNITNTSNNPISPITNASNNHNQSSFSPTMAIKKGITMAIKKEIMRLFSSTSPAVSLFNNQQQQQQQQLQPQNITNNSNTNLTNKIPISHLPLLINNTTNLTSPAVSLFNNRYQQPQNNTSVQSSSSGTNPINPSFQMSGPMSSFISTPLSNWVVDGNWTLKVDSGNLSDFSSNMTWYPTNVTSPNIKQHTHSFSNFKVEPNNQNISLGVNNVLQIKGVMDIGAGLDRAYWKSVPAEIKTAGNTITITLDDSKTGFHFNNYSVFGKINSHDKYCSSKPVEQFSANMQISELPTCS